MTQEDPWLVAQGRSPDERWRRYWRLSKISLSMLRYPCLQGCYEATARLYSTPSQMILDTYLSFGWQGKDVDDRASGSHKLLSGVRCLQHLHLRCLPSKHKVYVNHHMARVAYTESTVVAESHTYTLHPMSTGAKRGCDVVMPYGFSRMKRIAQNTCVRSGYWLRAVGGGLVVVTLEALGSCPILVNQVSAGAL